MEFSLLKKADIDRIGEIDRTEIINYIYYYKNGKLELIEELCKVNKWSSEQELIHRSALKTVYDKGGFIFGAFDGSKIAGVISLDSEFIGKRKNQLNLDGFWVSSRYRNMGIGSKLLELVMEKALEIGAAMLYVSATPSQNTVNFYLKRGFKLADEIIEKLYELEPDDIHMVRNLI
ncbi:MAG: GNAT family N-acetyltransferase [Candidatus Kariarchaeaceae archaeon]|jgi:GNAT superfamily N-acetyltransferase